MIGQFVPTGRLVLKYAGQQVADLAMEFLHDGRPPVVRDAVYAPPSATSALRERAQGAGRSGQQVQEQSAVRNPQCRQDLQIPQIPNPSSLPTITDSLLKILASLNVCSKEWVIRQYDHEVQGGSVIKPLVGVANDGPSDAAVLRPVLTSLRGIVVSCGMNPRYGDFDTYWMAASAIDEAVRNCVAVGADPSRIAILDNFCWGTTDRPETLGSLVRAALACHDVAIALGTPFISGKDSLNNEFRQRKGVHSDGAMDCPRRADLHPAVAADQCPGPGRRRDAVACRWTSKSRAICSIIVGLTKDELGGSHFSLVEGLAGGEVPKLDAPAAKKTFAALHKAIHAGLVRACHDLSEGGLAVAAAEMAFAGGLGAKSTSTACPTISPRPPGEGPGVRARLPSPIGKGPAEGSAASIPPPSSLFSESNTRFLCEVEPERADAFEALLSGVPHARIGEVTDSAKLEILSGGDVILSADLSELKEAWQKPLRW